MLSLIFIRLSRSCLITISAFDSGLRSIGIEAAVIVSTGCTSLLSDSFIIVSSIGGDVPVATATYCSMGYATSEVAAGAGGAD